MTSAPDAIFQGIKSEADLEQWVTEGKPEDLYLEFKQKAGPNPGELDEQDEKNFSKALSSLANADGGVLVFGVETKRSGDEDRATALKPIPKVEQFRARLLDSVNTTTQPVVEGVRIEVVPSGGDSGYVECLVPASDRPPHRAMQYERRYWKRNVHWHS